MNKTAIRKFAEWAREKLIEDIKYKAGTVGITANGIVEKLPQSTSDTYFYDVGTKDYMKISGVEIKQRDALVKAIQTKERSYKSYQEAFENVIEEVAYTWFNRLIVIRFMEVNDYLPLVVEGEDDKIALTKILKSLSPTLKEALNKNTFVIQPLSGASNLNYELNRLRSFVCKYFVFLDNDDAGISAGDKAIEKGLLTEADIKYTICNGNPQAEFEDCLNKDFYIEKIKDRFSVDLSVATFRGSKKWSDNVKDAFLSQGQRWTETIEKKVKTIVADAIPDENADGVLNQHKRGSIDALVTALENMLTYR